MPVFNGEAHLRESLDSIVAQTYRRREILVLDDASTDATPTILGAYGGAIQVLRNPQNLGQFSTVNRGIERARGDLICVYHADDRYDPRIVEREVEYLTTWPEAGAVFALDRFMDADGGIYGQLQLPAALVQEAPLTYDQVLNGMLLHKNRFLVGPTSMVRRRVYEEVGGYRGESYRIASDLEMWMRIARRHRIGILPEHLHDYRHGHGNLSQNYYRLRTETEIHFRILDEHLEAGGRRMATPRALRAHEAHRAEDALMVAINHYILGDQAGCRAMLARSPYRGLVASPAVQRWRLTALRLFFGAAARLPRSEGLAGWCRRRWHGGP